MNLVHEGLYCTHQNLALSPLNILWLRTTWSAENAAFCVDRSPAASLAASGESVWFIYSLLKKVSPLTQDHKEWSRQSKGSVIFSFWTGQRHHSSFFTCLSVSLAGQPEDWLLAATSVALSLTHHPWDGCTRVTQLMSLSSFIHSFIRGTDPPTAQLMTFSAFILLGRTQHYLHISEKTYPFPHKEQSPFNIFIENWSWNTSTFGIKEFKQKKDMNFFPVLQFRGL